MSLGLVNVEDGAWAKVRRNFNRLDGLLLGPNSTPSFSTVTVTGITTTTITVSGLTASRLVATNTSSNLTSVDPLTDWIAGTENEINVTDDGDGTITIGIVDPLIVSKGGTGSASLTDHAVLVGSGTGAITPLSVATNGQLVIGITGSDPTLATLTGTSNQVTVTNGAGSITLSTPQDIAVTSDVEFQSVLVDQDTDDIGIEIDSEATTLTNYGLKVVTGAGAGVALFSHGATENGVFYCGLPNNDSMGGNFFFARDLAAAVTDCAIVYIHQDNAGDDQPCLELQQDGTGFALLTNGNIRCDGNFTVTGTTTYEGNIIIPDDGYIGSASDVDAIQIEADGDVVLSQRLYVTGDLHMTGNIIMSDGAGIGVTDNNPLIVFDDTDSQVEITGTLYCSDFITNNCCIFGSNSVVFQPGTDSTTFFQIKDKDGTAHLTYDTMNDALLFPNTTKLGTTEGSYNLINGSAFAAKSGYAYCLANGKDIANAATGNVYNNNLVGSYLANAATGNVYYNNLVGGNIANSVTGNVDYNNLVGKDIANSATGNVYYNSLVGRNIANAATGNVYYNNLVGSYLANSATGNVYYNNLVGGNIANAATGNVYYNNLVGSYLANAATGNVYYNNLVGRNIANAATGDVYYNNLVGYQNADGATGNIINCTICGSNIARSFTGSMDSVFSCGTLNLYNTTNEINLDKVIALPYEALRESSASDLDNAIAIGYRAGYQNAYDNPTVIGTLSSAYADKQCVLGSSYYTGGIVLDNERTYFHNHTHEDTDGGRETYLDFWGEQSGGEETTLARIEVSHDGAADDQKGKIVLSTNDGSDDDTPTTRLTIDSTGATDVIGDFTAGTIQADNGYTGSFTNGDGDTVTVVGGIITDIS